MKLLALEHERPAPSTAYDPPLLRSEAAGAWRLYLSGILREAYFDVNQHTAVLVLECASQEEASQVLANLPLVQAGLIEFEIIPLAPYDGFARLFGAE